MTVPAAWLNLTNAHKDPRCPSTNITTVPGTSHRYSDVGSIRLEEKVSTIVMQTGTPKNNPNYSIFPTDTDQRNLYYKSGPHLVESMSREHQISTINHTMAAMNNSDFNARTLLEFGHKKTSVHSTNSQTEYAHTWLDRSIYEKEVCVPNSEFPLKTTNRVSLELLAASTRNVTDSSLSLSESNQDIANNIFASNGSHEDFFRDDGDNFLKPPPVHNLHASKEIDPIFHDDLLLQQTPNDMFLDYLINFIYNTETPLFMILNRSSEPTFKDTSCNTNNVINPNITPRKSIEIHGKLPRELRNIFAPLHHSGLTYENDSESYLHRQDSSVGILAPQKSLTNPKHPSGIDDQLKFSRVIDKTAYDETTDQFNRNSSRTVLFHNSHKDRNVCKRSNICGESNEFSSPTQSTKLVAMKNTEHCAKQKPILLARYEPYIKVSPATRPTANLCNVLENGFKPIIYDENDLVENYKQSKAIYSYYVRHYILPNLHIETLPNQPYKQCLMYQIGKIDCSYFFIRHLLFQLTQIQHWLPFLSYGNEFKVNKEGRKIFPRIEFVPRNLELKKRYGFSLKFCPIKEHTIADSVRKITIEEGSENCVVFCHKDIMEGSDWMRKHISFADIKLTNNRQHQNKPNMVVLKSSEKYVVKLCVQIYAESGVINSPPPIWSSFCGSINIIRFHSRTSYTFFEVNEMNKRFNKFANGERGGKDNGRLRRDDQKIDFYSNCPICYKISSGHDSARFAPHKHFLALINEHIRFIPSEGVYGLDYTGDSLLKTLIDAETTPDYQKCSVFKKWQEPAIKHC